MLTENERKENIEFQEKVEAKLSKKFGHAIPQIDRNRPIENNFQFEAIDREKLQEVLKDLNMEEYNLWRKFNNKEERRRRHINVKFIDEPNIDDVEIKNRIDYNNKELLEITLKQVEEYPELFNDSDS